MFQIYWRKCEFCTPNSTINSSSTRSQQGIIIDSDCLKSSTSGRLNSCAWLLFFEVLREIISLCSVSCGICCTTLSVDSIIVNYRCWRCVLLIENKNYNFQWNFHGGKKSFIFQIFLFHLFQYSTRNIESISNIQHPIKVYLLILYWPSI